MRQRWLAAGFVVIYTLGVAISTAIWERRNRMDCFPEDDSCRSTADVTSWLYWLTGFFVWATGVLILFFVLGLWNRFANRNAKPS